MSRSDNMRARLKTTSALSGIFVGSWVLAPGDHGKILEMFERQPSSSIPPDPPGCERRSIRICDRQSQLRITGSIVLIVSGFMNDPICINRVSYLRLLLMVPVPAIWLLGFTGSSSVDTTATKSQRREI